MLSTVKYHHYQHLNNPLRTCVATNKHLHFSLSKVHFNVTFLSMSLMSFSTVSFHLCLPSGHFVLICLPEHSLIHPHLLPIYAPATLGVYILYIMWVYWIFPTDDTAIRCVFFHMFLGFHCTPIHIYVLKFSFSI